MNIISEETKNLLLSRIEKLKFRDTRAGNVEGWDNNDVIDWLETLPFGSRLSLTFRDKQTAGLNLVQLTDSDLEHEYGVDQST
eukprot:TRINITY_DN8360_c0_g1_i1.p2 TRINITY_DN8360_c0_g1~~TRINITY_DN8360_c0_g1_i1.p2  ORF type:complete len:83 (-),score=5.58 TRINITY_DN8360_c0_g1_i1:199-447(-)